MKLLDGVIISNQQSFGNKQTKTGDDTSGKMLCYENKVLSGESVDKMQTKPHGCYCCGTAHLLPLFEGGIQMDFSRGKREREDFGNSCLQI